MGTVRIEPVEILGIFPSTSLGFGAGCKWLVAPVTQENLGASVAFGPLPLLFVETKCEMVAELTLSVLSSDLWNNTWQWWELDFVYFCKFFISALNQFFMPTTGLLDTLCIIHNWSELRWECFYSSVQVVVSICIERRRDTDMSQILFIFKTFEYICLRMCVVFARSSFSTLAVCCHMQNFCYAKSCFLWWMPSWHGNI